MSRTRVPRETDLRSVNYSALSAPIEQAEVAAFEAETTASTPGWVPRRATTSRFVVLVVLAILFIGVPGLVVVGGLVGGLTAGSWGTLIVLGPTAITGGSMALPFILPAIRAPRRDFGWQEHYRLSRFAWENGLVYSSEALKPQYPGVLFKNLPALAYDHLTPATGPFFEIGNLRYGDSDDTAMSEVGHRGFLAIYIGGRLPQILLDAKSNDGLLGGIGTQFAGHPTVKLEGNFNRHFTLFCPTGYERDALYLFTPDFMVDLLDESLAFDVELIDAWMFVYSMKPLDLTDPAVLQRLFRIVETVGERAARRSSRYRDDQYSSPKAFAAKSTGPRMAMSLPAWIIVLPLAFLASFAWISLSIFLGAKIGM